MEIKKINLNAFKGKKGLQPNQVESIRNELNSYGIKIQYIDPFTNYTEVVGYDNKGKAEHTEVNDLPKMLKNLREIQKLEERVNKWRKKLDVQKYETKPLRELTRETSSKLEGFTGHENYLKTLNKILAKDPKTNRNKIQEADHNIQKLRKVKVNAFDDVDLILSKSQGSAFNPDDYKKPNGKFRSKQAERDYLKLFSDVIEDQDYDNSQNEFFGWLYDKYGDEFKSAYGTMNDNERSEHYGEYQKEKLQWILDAEGSYERDEIEMTDEEVIMRMGKIRKNVTKKRGKRK